MIQVKEGKIVRYSLPKTGELSDGRTVSGYNNLPEGTLREEGWLPLAVEEPEYNPDTHVLTFDRYDIQKDRVVKLYKVIEIPEPTPTEMDRVEALEEIVLEMMLGGSLDA